MDRHQASVTEVNAYLNDLILRDRCRYHLINHENLNQRELYVDAKHLSEKLSKGIHKEFKKQS